MSENFNLSLDIDETIDNLEELKKKIVDIPEIDVKDTKTMDVGLCLLITIGLPLITQVVIKKAVPAIRKLKNRIKEVLKKGKESSDKAKVTIQYKELVIPMENEKEIELGVDRLVNYD